MDVDESVGGGDRGSEREGRNAASEGGNGTDNLAVSVATSVGASSVSRAEAAVMQWYLANNGKEWFAELAQDNDRCGRKLYIEDLDITVTCTRPSAHVSRGQAAYEVAHQILSGALYEWGEQRDRALALGLAYDSEPTAQSVVPPEVLQELDQRAHRTICRTGYESAATGLKQFGWYEYFVMQKRLVQVPGGGETVVEQPTIVVDIEGEIIHEGYLIHGVALVMTGGHSCVLCGGDHPPRGSGHDGMLRVGSCGHHHH